MRANPSKAPTPKDPDSCSSGSPPSPAPPPVAKLVPTAFSQQASISRSNSHQITPLHHPMSTDSALSSHTHTHPFLTIPACVGNLIRPRHTMYMLTCFMSFLFFRQFTHNNWAPGGVAAELLPNARSPELEPRNRCGGVSGARASSGGAAGCGTWNSPKLQFQ